jgi:hypothetical protein
MQTTDKGGRTAAAGTVRRQVARVMNRSAHQLAESVLAKALTGDSTAQTAAVQLLALGLNQPQK